MSRFDAVRDGVSAQRVLVRLGIHVDSSRVCRLLSYRPLAARSPAGALIFRKRAGQHFAEPSETPDQLTAQPAQPQIIHHAYPNDYPIPPIGAGENLGNWRCVNLTRGEKIAIRYSFTIGYMQKKRAALERRGIGDTRLFK
jgi:hypothetical protein